MSNVTDVQDEIDRAPFLAGRMRRETAVMLGAICADDGLSTLDLPEQMSRSKQWRAALERGDFIPTFEMVSQLDGVLAFTQSPVEYSPTVIEIESFPLGPTARKIRERYGLTPWVNSTPYEVVEIGAGLSPFAESIRARDRMLVTGPLLHTAVLLTLQVLLVMWSQDELSALVWPAIFGLPALLAFATVLALPFAERVLAFLCHRWRSEASSDRLKSINLSRDAAGLTITHQGSWYQPGEDKHLLSAVRLNVQRSGIAADAMERMTLAFRLNAAVGIALTAALTIEEVGRVPTLTVATLTIIIGSLGLATHYSGIEAQKLLGSSIKTGLGLRLLPAPQAESEAQQKV